MNLEGIFEQEFLKLNLRGSGCTCSEAAIGCSTVVLTTVCCGISTLFVGSISEFLFFWRFGGGWGVRFYIGQPS